MAKIINVKRKDPSSTALSIEKQTIVPRYFVLKIDIAICKKRDIKTIIPTFDHNSVVEIRSVLCNVVSDVI
jgi:hypothetical protein